MLRMSLGIALVCCVLTLAAYAESAVITAASPKAALVKSFDVPTAAATVTVIKGTQSPQVKTPVKPPTVVTIISPHKVTTINAKKTPTTIASAKAPALPEAHISTQKPLPPQPSPGLFTNAEWEQIVSQEKMGSAPPKRVSPAEALLISLKEPEFSAPLPVEIIAMNNGPSGITRNGKSVPKGSVIEQANRRLLWPMRGGLVSSRYGIRWGRMHEGTDIAAPLGTPILAAGRGQVVFTGWQGGYGNLIIISHPNGYLTKYGHCDSILVKMGQTIKQGQMIGRVGSTGHSTGPHLHYEVLSKKDGMNKNPEAITHRPLFN